MPAATENPEEIDLDETPSVLELVRLLRPAPPAKSFAYEPHVEPLYRVVERRLQAQDQDQEVKECAITCMGTMLIHFADPAVVEPAVVLPIILERMRNEITRVTAVKTFGHISSAKLDVGSSDPCPSASKASSNAAAAEAVIVPPTPATAVELPRPQRSRR